MKLGTTVTYQDGNARQTGTIERMSDRTGQRLYRVNDRWFPRGAFLVGRGR